MLGDRRPIVVAHRGGAAEAPENTIVAFERAIRLGYPGVEFDVRRSKDGIPVVVHDERVRPKAGASRRPVAALLASDLAGFPKLDEVLALPWGRTVLMVEVKPTAHDRELGPAAARAIAARGLASQAVLASFSAEVLRSAIAAEKGIPIMALLDSETDEGSFSGLPLFGWGVDVALVTSARVKPWKAGGREVWTWTIKDLAQMRRALDAGVSGLITDIPGAVLKHL